MDGASSIQVAAKTEAQKSANGSQTGMQIVSAESKIMINREL